MTFFVTMKYIFVFLSICMSCKILTAQVCWSLDQGWIPCSSSDTLSDKQSGVNYVIVRSERCIKAYDHRQTILWETNPWHDKQLTRMYGLNWNSYLHPDSIFIRTIDFPKTDYMGRDKSIVVYFSDRIVGSIDKKTGRFSVIGEN